MSLKDVAQTAQGFAIAGATIIGGLWTLYRYRSERKFESEFDIDLVTTSHKIDRWHFVFVEAALRNKGRRKIEAKRARDTNGWVYADAEERLTHSCSLQVKRCAVTAFKDAYLDWYSAGQGFQPVEGIPEIDLATEYENPSSRETEFWLEPGEGIRLGSALLLSPGDYLLKLTFVGMRKDVDYWSTIRYLHLD